MSASGPATKVEATAEGLVRLTTPEGQAIDLTPERARELIASAELHRRMRRCLHELPIQVNVSKGSES